MTDILCGDFTAKQTQDHYGFDIINNKTNAKVGHVDATNGCLNFIDPHARFFYDDLLHLVDIVIQAEASHWR